MACGLVLDPRQDFPAWLSTQGVNSHVAQAVERELGIGDYEALLACAESAQVRSELFVLARERLSFATYAVLRRAIEGLASRRSDAVDVAQGLEALGLQPFLSGLLDSMVVLLTSVSQDLSHSAQRLRSLEPTLYGEVAEATSSLSQGYAVSDPGVTTGPEDMYRYDVVEEEEDESLVDQKPPANYAEECNEIGAVEQQIPEASLNEQMIEDESQTIGSIVGRSSEHLLDVHFVKREPSAVGDGGIDDLKTKRKRFRLEPEARKRSVDKILWDTRNKNTTSSNHLVPDKRMKPDGACCPKRCMESVHYDHRRQLFDTFWRMTNKIEQDLFLCSSVSEMPVQRHYNKAKPQLSRRQHTRCYSFSLETGPVQVCKLLFLGTLGISSGRLDRALKRQKIPSVEMSHPLDVYPKYFASVSSCPPQILPKPSATW